MSSTWGKWAAALCAGLVLLTGAAAAERCAGLGCGSAPSAKGPAQYNSGYDRSFIREWQANPPKGYPTLSKAQPGADQGGRRPLRGDRRRAAAFR